MLRKAKKTQPFSVIRESRIRAAIVDLLMMGAPWYGVMAKVVENGFTLAANKPRAMGNVINTPGVRMGMGSPVYCECKDHRYIRTVSSVYSSSITTPSARGQVTNSVPQAYPFPCTIFELLAILPLGKFSGEGVRSRRTFYRLD